jgi:hypothetical protein
MGEKSKHEHKHDFPILTSLPLSFNTGSIKHSVSYVNWLWLCMVRTYLVMQWQISETFS